MNALLLTLLMVPRPVLSGAEKTLDSPGGLFKVHYCLDGVDAPVQAGDVDAVATGLDAVVAHWSTKVGMRMPIADSGGGGDSKIDVYLRQMQGGRGNTYAEDPMLNGTSSAWIEVDTRSAKAGAARLSAAAGHEVFHAIQYAYVSPPPRWLAEASATYVEHADFTGGGLEAETNRHWVSILSHPEVSIDLVDGTHEYDEMVFVKFLVDTRGGDAAMNQLWMSVASKGDADAAIEELAGKTSIELSLLAFGEWLWPVCPQASVDKKYGPAAICTETIWAVPLGVGALPSTFPVPLASRSFAWINLTTFPSYCSVDVFFDASSDGGTLPVAYGVPGVAYSANAGFGYMRVEGWYRQPFQVAFGRGTTPIQLSLRLSPLLCDIDDFFVQAMDAGAETPSDQSPVMTGCNCSVTPRSTTSTNWIIPFAFGILLIRRLSRRRRIV